MKGGPKSSLRSFLHRALQLLTVPKKMVTAHFTKIPCKPNAAIRHKENHIFWGNSSLY